MTTITITIQRSSVLSDIKVKNHHEAALIPDSKERYLVEAGTEKVQELHQCITDAFADASALMRAETIGTTSAQSETENDDYTSTGDLSFVMNFSDRKAPGLKTPLASALHKYVVDNALARYYKAVSHMALSQARESELAKDISTIENLIYHRSNPTYSLI